MSENNAKKKMSFGEIWQKFGTIGIFVLLLIILAVIKPDSVFNSSSVPQILKQSSVNVLLALGEFFAILIAGIDLSVGSVAALTGLLTAKMMIVGVPVPAAIPAGYSLWFYQRYARQPYRPASVYHYTGYTVDFPWCYPRIIKFPFRIRFSGILYSHDER